MVELGDGVREAQGGKTRLAFLLRRVRKNIGSLSATTPPPPPEVGSGEAPRATWVTTIILRMIFLNRSSGRQQCGLHALVCVLATA